MQSLALHRALDGIDSLHRFLVMKFSNFISSLENNRNNIFLSAKNAYGAMRDALTSLDMLIAFCGTQIKDEDLSQILEITENKDLEELLSSIIKQNTTSALLLFKNLCDKGIALQTILSDLLLLVHKISLLKSCPQSTVNEPNAIFNQICSFSLWIIS